MTTSADAPWSSSRPADVAEATLATAAPARDATRRIEAIDLARGIAVCLMILSHGVNGLLRFDQFTSWGLVPVHAITKFSSSLFFLVFGVGLAVAFVPKTSAADWPQRRNRLLRRGLVILFWYKVLTIVEMQHLHEPAEVVDALLYRRFPSYVEILGFYALALLWIPLVLPLWARVPRALRWVSPLVAVALAWCVTRFVPFGGAETLQALLVEHPDHYTWGQLSRIPLVLVGLLIGEQLRESRKDPDRRRRVALVVAASGLFLLLVYFGAIAPEFHAGLRAAALNVGKHPPELSFMLFSVGGALCLLGLALSGGRRLARILGPVTLVGSDALQAFIVHIAVLFLVLRTWLGYFHQVSYGFALAHAVGLIFVSAGWIWIHGRWRRAGRSRASAS